ncbi:MAG: hypothetical protein D6806_08920 [Deltaproteobacteria bacterium]|nr:MAG: hypothetical protein D6806_08920 [Deltaproteobacteria bacterium]
MSMEQIIVRVPSGKVRVKEGKCPNGCSLMNTDKLMSGKPAVTLLLRLKGQSGLIHLNPYYGVFEYESDIPLEKGDVVDMFCPHCGTSLMTEQECQMCHAPMFVIHLPKGGEVRVCPRVGCQNHQLTIVDLEAQFAELYEDERRPMM